MKSVLQLHDSSGLYGAEAVILNLAKALKKTKYYPILGHPVTRHGDKPSLGLAAEESGLAVEYMLMRNKVDLAIVMRVLRLIQRRDVRIVHCHGYKSNMIGMLAGKLAGIPVITTNHLFPPMPLEDKKLQFYSWVDAAFTMKRITKIIAVSAAIKDKLVAAGIDNEKIAIIDNGVDIETYSSPRRNGKETLRRSLNIDSNVYVVGTLGRLTQQKGVNFFLEAAKQLLAQGIPAVFLIAGEGPLQKELERVASESVPPGSIKFLGFRRDTPALLNIMDVFIMSSVDEGLPMAMIEAMASRTPVIMTAVGDVPKVIKDNVNGLLVEARNSAMLSSRLCQLLGNPALRSRLADRAFQDVCSSYSKEAMGLRYSELYDDILKKDKSKISGELTRYD